MGNTKVSTVPSQTPGLSLKRVQLTGSTVKGGGESNIIEQGRARFKAKVRSNTSANRLGYLQRPAETCTLQPKVPERRGCGRWRCAPGGGRGSPERLPGSLARRQRRTPNWLGKTSAHDPNPQKQQASQRHGYGPQILRRGSSGIGAKAGHWGHTDDTCGSQVKSRRQKPTGPGSGKGSSNWQTLYSLTPCQTFVRSLCSSMPKTRVIKLTASIALFVHSNDTASLVRCKPLAKALACTVPVLKQ